MDSPPEDQRGEEDAEAEMYWLQLSDFYDRPHVMTFDSVEDLGEKLKTADFAKIHEGMKRENRLRDAIVREKWCDVIKRS